MNKNYSHDGEYYTRWLAEQLRSAVQEHSVVVLTGARQVGKSTLLLSEAPFNEWPFVSMDDYDALARASDNPDGLWAGSDRVILDEVQRVPDLLRAVKLAVDTRPSRRFILSGSANLLLLEGISESLAGRAVYLTLHPMTLGEINRKPPPNLLSELLAGRLPQEGIYGEQQADLADTLLRGLMPGTLRLSTRQARLRWYDGYTNTYLERDLRQLAQVSSLVDFRRLMEMLALRNAQVLNQSELARDAGLSQSTTHRYLNLLESTQLFERLPAFSSNRTKRLVKAPKAFWVEPTLALYLAGIYDVQTLSATHEAGASLETLVFHHLRVLAGLLVPPARLYYWRDYSGTEVDFIIEHGRRLVAVEVKMGAEVHYNDTRALRSFIMEHPQTSCGVVFYTGATVRWFDKKLAIVPLPLLTG